ncbi:hypothetical protein Ocin01_07561 [Orchesella cincta]|uniref:Secreted protein n=1 Tax=Orchesella cincta TaxID=48709 RepID=A0A1D2N1E4_ORCCI|nr:hypothetical protein Ocin01_07561 [Orchesella cincta]
MVYSLVVLTVFTATSLITQCKFVNCFPFDNNYNLGEQSNYPLDNGAAADFKQSGQSSRKQRMAFPGIDVQENCPSGQVLHPSGKYCTEKPDPTGDDYIDEQKSKSKQRKQRIPWSLSGFDVQDRCPTGMVLHPSGTHCAIMTGEDDYSDAEDSRVLRLEPDNKARKQRFPGIDVQDNCPPGHVMHPSGKFCTYKGEEPDYGEYDGDTKSDDKTRKRRLPFAGFDVQDNCPLGQVMHPSGRFCTHISTGDDDYSK